MPLTPTGHYYADAWHQAYHRAGDETHTIPADDSYAVHLQTADAHTLVVEVSAAGAGLEGDDAVTFAFETKFLGATIPVVPSIGYGLSAGAVVLDATHDQALAVFAVVGDEFTLTATNTATGGVPVEVQVLSDGHAYATTAPPAP